MKTTATDSTIHGSSFHPFNHKHAAYHAMIHRVLSVPLSASNFQKEVNLIKSLAHRNSIHIDVDLIIKRKIQARSRNDTSTLFTTSALEDKKKTKWIRQPFLGNILYKISRILSKIGYRTVFYSLQRLKSISQLKDPVPLLSRSGVYLLKCDSCNLKYVGQTGRVLIARVKEHESEARSLQKRLSYKNSSDKDLNYKSSFADRAYCSF